MKTLDASRFKDLLDHAIDTQQGDHPRPQGIYTIVALLYIAKAIMHVGDMVDNCYCCLRHMGPQ